LESFVEQVVADHMTREVETVPRFTGADAQLWRIDQLTDGTYRISPKDQPAGAGVALVAIGASTPSLTRFDPTSDAGRWRFYAPKQS